MPDKRENNILSLLYVSGRPIDSKNLFWPLHQGFRQSKIKVQETVWSIYCRLFRKTKEKDTTFKNIGLQTFYYSPKSSIKKEFYKITKKVRPSAIIVPQDQPCIYQEIVDWSKDLSIPSIVLNEGPLTLIQMGIDRLVKSEKRIDYFKQKQEGPENLSQYIDEIINITKAFINNALLNKPVRKIPLRYRGQSGADLILVPGKHDYQNLIKLGVKKETVQEAGWLRSDILFDNNKLSRKQTLNKLGFKKNDNYVLLVSQSFKYSQVPVRYNDFIELLEAATVFSKFQPDLKFVLGIHPSVKKKEVRKAIKKHPLKNHVKLSKMFPDPFALYKNSEAVVGFYSTTLFDAMIARRPVITLDYVPLQLWYPFNIEYGAVIPVFHKFELENQIKRFYEDRAYAERTLENQKKLLKDVLGNPNGKVKLKAAKIIASFLNTRR